MKSEAFLITDTEKLLNIHTTELIFCFKIVVIIPYIFKVFDNFKYFLIKYSSTQSFFMAATYSQDVVFRHTVLSMVVPVLSPCPYHITLSLKNKKIKLRALRATSEPPRTSITRK